MHTIARMHAFPKRLVVLLASAVLLGASCGAPEVDATLALLATHRDVADWGEETVIKIVATDRHGHIGQGTVDVNAEAGSLLATQTLTLDAFGTATIPFSCNVTLDPACAGSVAVFAKWLADGKVVTAQLNLTVTQPPILWENDVIWDTTQRVSCSGSAPPQPPACVNGMCQHGFSCVNDACVLNGASGGLQYTLRFSQPVDLDLHLVEPLVDGGTCETFYGDPGRGGRVSSCGAHASLDLDSNAACVLDNVRTENVIFPRGKPVAGTYTARVDLYAACAETAPITWELQVRAGTAVRYYCGQFQPNDADMGGVNAGRTISTLVVPP